MALQQVLLPGGRPGTAEGQGAAAGAGPWALPFQDLMLRHYMTRCGIT